MSIERDRKRLEQDKRMLERQTRDGRKRRFEEERREFEREGEELERQEKMYMGRALTAKENQYSDRNRNYRREDEHNYESKKRARREERVMNLELAGEKGIFIGDSLIKPLVEDTGLECMAYENNWEVRLERGKGIEAVKEVADKERRREYKWMVVCGGSNNLANCKRREENLKTTDTILTYMREICRENQHQGIVTIMIVPPPRADI